MKEEPNVSKVFKAKKMPNFQAIHQKLNRNTGNELSLSKSDSFHKRPNNLVSTNSNQSLRV